MPHPTDRITHTTAFFTPVVGHWLKREIAQWVHHMKDRSDDPSHHERTLLPRSYISLPVRNKAKKKKKEMMVVIAMTMNEDEVEKMQRYRIREGGGGVEGMGEAGDVLVAPLFYFIFYFFPNYYLFIYYYLFFSKPLVSMIRQCSPPPPPHTHIHTMTVTRLLFFNEAKTLIKTPRVINHPQNKKQQQHYYH